MSRLGDLIRLERNRRGLTAKQVGKLSGTNEKYIADVESGKRIIQDSEARRILLKMGMEKPAEAEFSLDDIASTVDLAAAAPSLAKRPAPKKDQPPAQSNVESISGSIWLDALKNVLRSVPVLDGGMKEVGRRLAPVEQGKIAGAPPDKVFFYRMPDDALSVYRIHKNDLLLIVPQTAAQDGALMLIKTKSGTALYKVIELPRFQVMLQRFDGVNENAVENLSEISVIGKAVSLLAELT